MPSVRQMHSLINISDEHSRKNVFLLIGGYYTRNEWGRCKTTLEASGEYKNHTRNEWRRCKNPLETSEEDNVKVLMIKIIMFGIAFGL